MKALWDSQLLRHALNHKATRACWKPLSPLWNSALTLFYRHGVRKTVGADVFRFGVEHRRLKTSGYADEVTWMLQSFRPGLCVFDIGANIGITSLSFAKAVGPTGRVFAFEPSPDSFLSLKKQIRLNHFDQIITPMDYAVSNQPGCMEFWLNDDPYDMQHGPAIEPSERRRKIEVKTITLDTFCADQKLRPDILKIDIEGFEPLVLEGAASLIRHSPAMILYVELHPWVWPSIGYDDRKVLSLINDLGLRAETRDGSSPKSISGREHVLLRKQ